MTVIRVDSKTCAGLLLSDLGHDTSAQIPLLDQVHSAAFVDLGGIQGGKGEGCMAKGDYGGRGRGVSDFQSLKIRLRECIY